MTIFGINRVPLKFDKICTSFLSVGNSIYNIKNINSCNVGLTSLLHLKLLINYRLISSLVTPKFNLSLKRLFRDIQDLKVRTILIINLDHKELSKMDSFMKMMYTLKNYKNIVRLNKMTLMCTIELCAIRNPATNQLKNLLTEQNGYHFNIDMIYTCKDKNASKTCEKMLLNVKKFGKNELKSKVII